MTLSVGLGLASRWWVCRTRVTVRLRKRRYLRARISMIIRRGVVILMWRVVKICPPVCNGLGGCRRGILTGRMKIPIRISLKFLPCLI